MRSCGVRFSASLLLQVVAEKYVTNNRFVQSLFRYVCCHEVYQMSRMATFRQGRVSKPLRHHSTVDAGSKRGEHRMSEDLKSLLFPLALLVGWFVLNAWILPKFGVKT